MTRFIKDMVMDGERCLLARGSKNRMNENKNKKIKKGRMKSYTHARSSHARHNRRWR
jgi:hypothetical protein